MGLVDFKSTKEKQHNLVPCNRKGRQMRRCAQVGL
jgi:hypothetical protein